MHYAIASKVAERIVIKDYNRFIIGSLAPDMSSHIDGSYTVSHFGCVCIEKGIKGIDFIKFCNKYRSQILEDDFILGYFVHLITDSYWLKNIQDRFVRKKDKQEKKRLAEQGYREMRRYNAILIPEYKLINNIKSVDNITVEEVSISYINQLLSDLFADFSSGPNGGINFQIYPFDIVMSFLVNSAERCVQEINALLENGQQGNPEDFYVTLS